MKEISRTKIVSDSPVGKIKIYATENYVSGIICFYVEKDNCSSKIHFFYYTNETFVIDDLYVYVRSGQLFQKEAEQLCKWMNENKDQFFSQCLIEFHRYETMRNNTEIEDLESQIKELRQKNAWHGYKRTAEYGDIWSIGD